MNNTLIKGLSLLQLLAHSSRAQGVTELAQQMGVAKSHAHRLLQTLVEQGYAHREDPGNYRISMRVWELGQTAIGNHDLLRAAAGPMQTLLEQTRETVHLAVLERREVVYVHQLDGPNRPPTSIGSRAPAHCVATGKAQLAYLSEDQLGRFAAELASFTPATVTDRQQFLDEMATIRRDGFAVNRGEWREAVFGIAAPVRNGDGKVVAAVGIVGPSERFAPGNWRALASPVISAAGQIAARIDAPAAVAA